VCLFPDQIGDAFAGERGKIMTHRLAFSSLLLVALLLTLAPAATAKNTWYVDGVHGNDNNDCKSPQTACKTIGHAISLASSGDSIMVAAATYTENLSIGFSLKVIGSGAMTTIIDGGAAGTVVTISGVFTHVTLSKLTVRNGLAPLGGGVYNAGTLNVNDCAISSNSAMGGMSGDSGGGIYNLGTLTVNNTTLSGNVAAFSSSLGGGIYSSGPLTINNSTLSNNSSRGGRGHPGSGGAIYSRAAATISSSTIGGNYAISGAGVATPDGGTTVLQNTILANVGNCFGHVTSNGYNLSNDITCHFTNTGDLNNTDPKLGPLQNNGGPTPTQALLSGSPAIDAGNPNGCTDGQGHLLKTDQRGKPRHDKEDTGGCDMGAYERQSD
jgi:hypothetical protein